MRSQFRICDEIKSPFLLEWSGVNAINEEKLKNWRKKNKNHVKVFIHVTPAPSKQWMDISYKDIHFTARQQKQKSLIYSVQPLKAGSNG